MSDLEPLNVDPDAHFRPGNRGLLVLMGQRYLIAVQSVENDIVHVSFPAQDFPVDGMHVDIEFHDNEGYVRYETEVLQGPQSSGDGLALKMPEAVQQMRHRTRWRVPADFEAKIKDHVHPRVHRVPVVNISAGGMLMRTLVDLKLGDDMDVGFNLPQSGPIRCVGQVVHVSDPEEDTTRSKLVGVRFVGLGDAEQRNLTHYVWRRVRELSPEGLIQRRRKTDEPTTQATGA